MPDHPLQLVEILPGVRNAGFNRGQDFLVAQEPFLLESNRETDKVESFADDKTVTFLATEIGLRAVCEILQKFETISGLACNMDKSSIMYIGSDDPPPRYLYDFEFALVDKIKILGLTINREATRLQDCHEATVIKIRKIATFWDRFFLSLPGRINIAKTMMLSQLSYLGCIISPSKDQLLNIKTIVDKFIVGKLNVAKDRIYRPTTLGGLGMIDLSEFITAQQTVWFKRASASTRDNWRVDLKKLSRGNILAMGADDVPGNAYPIFKYLCCSYETFLQAFSRGNDNFKKSYIVNNPLIKRGRADTRKITCNLFSGNNPALNAQSISKIKVSDIATDNRLLSLDDISLNTGLPINLVTYLRLQEAFFASSKLFNEPRSNNGSSLSVNEFFVRFRKGSKQIRNILCLDRCRKIKVDELQSVRAFETLINIADIPVETKKSCLSFWSNNFLPMDLREFSFKFFNNTLGINQRIANYVNGRMAGCSFCTIFNNGPIPPETFIHLFFDCPQVTAVRNWFENTFLPDIHLANREDKVKFWFYGITPDANDCTNVFTLTLVQTILFCIWRLKLLKRLPVRNMVEIDGFLIMNRIIRACKEIREFMINSNYLLCRNWDQLSHRRG